MSTLSDLLARAKAANKDRPADRELETPGVYLAKVVFANRRKTKNGDPMLSMKFEVIGPSGANQPEDQAGAKIWSNQSLIVTDDTNVSIFFKTMAALGLNEDWWAVWGDDVEAAFEAAKDAIVDRVVQIKVLPGKSGYRKVEVKFINAAPGQSDPVAPPAAAPARRVPPAVRPVPRKLPTPPGAPL